MDLDFIFYGFGFGFGLSLSHGLDWILDSNYALDLDLDLDLSLHMDSNPNPRIQIHAALLCTTTLSTLRASSMRPKKVLIMPLSIADGEISSINIYANFNIQVNRVFP